MWQKTPHTLMNADFKRILKPENLRPDVFVIDL
jgi:hypothetical protein